MPRRIRAPFVGVQAIFLLAAASAGCLARFEIDETKARYANPPSEMTDDYRRCLDRLLDAQESYNALSSSWNTGLAMQVTLGLATGVAGAVLVLQEQAPQEAGSLSTMELVVGALAGLTALDTLWVVHSGSRASERAVEVSGLVEIMAQFDLASGQPLDPPLRALIGKRCGPRAD